MRRIAGDQWKLRIYIGENDRHGTKPLYRAIVEKAKEMGLAGATVLRGIAGFGPHSVYHTEKILRLSRDLPVLVEIIDSKEKIEEFVGAIEPMIESGLITLERIRVIKYTHKHEKD